MIVGCGLVKAHIKPTELYGGTFKTSTYSWTPSLVHMKPVTNLLSCASPQATKPLSKLIAQPNHCLNVTKQYVYSFMGERVNSLPGAAQGLNFINENLLRQHIDSDLIWKTRDDEISCM